MQVFRSLLVAAVLLTPACTLFHKPIRTASPSPVMATTTSLGVATDGLRAVAGGYNVAETAIVSTLPPSRTKDAALEVMEDQEFILGAPDPATRSKYEGWALDLISTETAKVTAAEAQRQTFADAATQLKTEVDTLKATQIAQLKTLNDQHAIDLANANAAADAKVKAIVSYIFFGLAALCILGAIAVGMLAASYPLFGPKAALALAAAGITSGAMGVGIIKLMDVSVMYWGIGAIVLLISIAVVLVYSNHSHAVTPATSNAPVK